MKKSKFSSWRKWLLSLGAGVVMLSCGGTSGEKDGCPEYELPSDWCSEGKIIEGGKDSEGCDLPPRCEEIPEEEACTNYSPQTSLHVSTNEGFSPLEVTVIGNASHEGESDCLKSCNIAVGDYVSSDCSFEETFTFLDEGGPNMETINVSFEAEDTRGDTSTENKTITVYHPRINQNLDLVNLVDLDYSVNLTNFERSEEDAEFVLFNDGNPILSRMINSSNYNETFSYQNNTDITKGNYCAELNWNGNSNSTCKEIPNYLPEFDSSGLEVKLDEGEEKCLNLEDRLSDPNPEDSPQLIDAESLDGKTEVYVNSQGEVCIYGNDVSEGDFENFEVGIEFGNESGGINNSIFEGSLYNLLDISGTLEQIYTDFDNPGNLIDLPSSGIVRIYEVTEDNRSWSNNCWKALGTNKIEEIEVGNDGNFNQRINQRISSLEDYLLIQGRTINPLTQEYDSYVRTFLLEKGDIENLELKAKSFRNLSELENGVMDILPEDFRYHIIDVASSGNANNPPPEWAKFASIISRNISLDDLISGNFYIDISKTARDAPDNSGYFSEQTAQDIRYRIIDTYDIGGIFQGYLIPENIRIFYHGDDGSNEDGRRVQVYPNEEIQGGMALRLSKIIEIGSTEEGDWVNPGTLTHEMLHMIGQAGHSWTLPRELTVMHRTWDWLTPYGPRPADLMSSRIYFEPTYTHERGSISMGDPMLGVIDVLGLRFADDEEE